MVARLGLFLLGLFVCDRAVAAALDLAFARTLTGDGSGHANNAIRNRDRDVIFFGSSRARQHFDPEVLEEETGLTGFNAGANGQGIFYARVLARLLIERGTRARYFVLQVDDSDVFYADAARIGFLRPFAGDSQLVVDLLETYDDRTRLKLALSDAYRYNSAALSVLRNFLVPRPPDGTGFSPQTGSGIPRVFVEEERPVDAGGDRLPVASPDSRELIADFVADARRAGILTVLVSVPEYSAVRAPAGSRQRTRRAIAWDALASWADELDVTYLSVNEADYPAFRSATLFADTAHLNVEGARLLTRIVARQLPATR